MLQQFSLKDRKFAKTRTRLTFAFLSELEFKSFDEIKIKDLCQIAEVSEPTFYNYFPEKGDLLLHYIQVWSLQVSVFAKEKKLAESGFGILSALFRYTAKESKKNPRVLLEIISFQARVRKKLQQPKLTKAERVLLFPKIDGIEDLEANGVEGIIRSALTFAAHNGELPTTTDWKSLSMAIASCFFGVPVISFQMNQNIEKLWLESLYYLWCGAGGKVTE
ncbi:TetR/AcrR family transcriptional regulator [Leptospira sp. 2 VSF19]|uniref:TetR/AcrR family transcriptional regulator n=1 Tax=Leptospira soteropolitanensis TaxID=2950025 RepID=A0AAW5VFC5_9LEPT|nr:TetR/AcrR family transcriptional regulator [Leptospira soteropolitanensis]MCW7493631.1 TetR/AcrR family transcriptional regulator [Leptospira soteropolitanensis]MCW7501230.1 TetR/AcrR family transcriptional regulator [Leptospira soteropolitanensis]MCW7523584.1 TetR/AcrR family transcriptional regulator [Leptospira soteropolitanensis]MCW7527343.1 TetR/AcrR family transcriptional regulator [Leptospira soteropolitanensis]MCW7531200.1 TetR/AcrR family transcriptional regulator [Leptospira soter